LHGLQAGGKANMMYELPLLLRSMRLVESADLSQHLVVVCNNAAAASACRRLHSRCLVDDWATAASRALVTVDDAHHSWSTDGFNKANWRRRELMNDVIRQVTVYFHCRALQIPWSVWITEHPEPC
jgi:hypothetical protein